MALKKQPKLQQTAKGGKPRLFLVLVAIFILLVGAGLGIWALKKETQIVKTSATSVKSAPQGIRSVPGTSEASPAQAKLIQEKNMQLAKAAQARGGSAVPTITQASYIGQPEQIIESAQGIETAAPGCDPKELERARLAGVQVDELRCKGCTTAQLKSAGYAAGELYQIGLQAKELKAGGYTPSELKESGYTAKEVNEAGFSVDELKDAGYSAAALRNANYSAKDLKDVGFTAGELKAAGFSADQLKMAGFSPADLKATGITAAELAKAGFNNIDLNEAGYKPADLVAAGLSDADLLQVGVSGAQIKTARAAVGI